MREDLRGQILNRIGGEHLPAFVESLGFALRRVGGEYKCLCPFHNDTKPSFCINVRKRDGGIFKCFACDWGGDIFDFVGHLHGLKGFIEQADFIAKQIGIRQGDSSATPRAALPMRESKSEPVVRMTPGEVLDALEKYQKAALKPDEWMERLGVDVKALDLVGGVVAPYAHSPDRVVLVIPQRRADGSLCSLRFRCFETKKRWSLDVKERRDGEWLQIKSSDAGLMAVPEAFDPALCGVNLWRVAVEGETDLLAGITILLRSHSGDPIEWPAQFVGIPGVGSCHEMLMAMPPVDLNVLFFDGDNAAQRAVFFHRHMKRVGGGPDVKIEHDLDRPAAPGLLAIMHDRKMRAVAVFPPRREKKYDLRDMCRDGWTWSDFHEHCLRHGTADHYGRKAIARRKEAV